MTAAQPVTDFLKAIEFVEPAYGTATIRYLAGRKDSGTWGLLQARITSEPLSEPLVPRTFETDHLRAGYFRATGPAFLPAALLETLTTGHLPIEDGMIAFDTRDGGGYDYQSLKSYPDIATNTQNRHGLRIGGGWVNSVANIHELGWELLGAEPPFEGLQELVNAFGLGELQQHNAMVELWTTPVLKFSDGSGIAGTQARLSLWLAEALDPSCVDIRRKLRASGDSFPGGPILTGTLAWTSEGNGHVAIVDFPVPEHSQLLCSLSYRRLVQSFAVLANSRPMANERRLLYETVDVGLGKLITALEAFKRAEQNSAEFELLMARLFWLAGFNTLYLGKDKATERSGDIVALTEGGDVLLIECTTGILKKDKRSQLLRRAQVMREALPASPATPASVIPLMVTCLPWAQIQTDAEEAQADGIAIYCYEDIAELLADTIHPPDAAGRFAAIEHRLTLVALANGYVDEF